MVARVYSQQISDGTFRVRVLFLESGRVAATHGMVARSEQEAGRVEARARGALRTLGIDIEDEAAAA